MAIREKVFDREHPDIAATYNSMAEVCSAQGDYAKALGWLQKALEVFEKVLGKEHPCTLRTYKNIAETCDSQGDYAKALEWRQEALAICETGKQFGGCREEEPTPKPQGKSIFKTF